MKSVTRCTGATRFPPPSLAASLHTKGITVTKQQLSQEMPASRHDECKISQSNEKVRSQKLILDCK